MIELLLLVFGTGVQPTQPIENEAVPPPVAAAEVAIVPGPGAACVAPPAAVPDGLAAAPPDDHWFAEDKARHATLSFAATPFAYGTARLAGVGHDESVLAAAGFAVAAGIWKEIRDERIGRGWSAKDLVWDAIGVAAGVLWVREIQ